MNEKKKLLIKVAICVAIALISIFVISPRLSNVETYKNEIKLLDEAKANVLGLTASATGISAGLTIIPSDICTPIAEQFAVLAKNFLIVLCALFLEKYAMTIIGYFAFTWMIPIALGLIVINMFRKNKTVLVFSARLIIFAIAASLVIPVSVKISGMIQSTYQASVDKLIADSNGEAKDLEDTKVFDLNIGKKIKNTFNSFIESVAVMIVTSCLIPIIVIIVFVWMLRVILKIDIDVERFGYRLSKKPTN